MNVFIISSCCTREGINCDVIPEEFRDAVDRAKATAQRGDLELFAAEAQGFTWEIMGLRLVGRAQLILKAYESGCVTWETIRKRAPHDLEANLTLGFIYQRLGDLVRSDQALRRVVSQSGLRPYERVEAYARIGSNAKLRWQDEWAEAPMEQQRELALGSPSLMDAYAAYACAFAADPNHYSVGLNVLALSTILIVLAEALPSVWEANYNSREEAAHVLHDLQVRHHYYVDRVALALDIAMQRLQGTNQQNGLLELSHAILLCLTSNHPFRVAQSYRTGVRDAEPAHVAVARRQLALFQQLGIQPANVQAGLAALATLSETWQPESSTHVLLFTGHRIDAPDRALPRFPAAKEAVARQAIYDVVQQELDRFNAPVIGLAGGASGGDLLFHAVCRELGIMTQLYLALPREAYIMQSVQTGDSAWVGRFNTLYKQIETRVLHEHEALPLWLRDKPDYTIWQRTNLWMLYNSLVYGGANVTLIALWNGQRGDGVGGTDDMIRQAQTRGARTIILNTNELFRL